MSKINEIEKAIVNLEGGRYQKLMDQYLFKRYGFTNIQCLGSQEGTDKTTKGVPDSYVLTPDGKYILIMYGTHDGKQSGTTAFNKCKADIESCLNRINKDDIYEIICCHISSNLTIEHDKKLHSLFHNLTLIGLNTLAEDLYLNYPNLAKEFLNVSIDTYQIMSEDEFIRKNNKSVYETPLDVNLIGRKQEKEELLKLLHENNLIIVEGPSGVGKTKLSFEVCKEFASTNQFQFYVIKSRNLQIYDDLQSYFSKNGNYIILVDDANQISDLVLILELIKENNQLKQFKIVLTVRDYAKNSTVSAVRDVIDPIEYPLTALDSKVIEDIIKSNLEITNPIFLEQISKIAKGNIRLAYMAGISSKKEGAYKNIRNAKEIFEKYFKYAIANRSQMELIMMAIFAFVESFDLDNTDSLVYSLASIKNINESEIKAACVNFYDVEIVDIYENYIAKFNDQSLRDYIFYYIFFEEKIYPLEELIRIVFPVNSEKIVFNLNTTFRLFYSHKTHDYLSTCVKALWTNNNFDENLIMKFAVSFHSLIDDEVLLFVKGKLDQVKVEQIDILNYKLKDNIRQHNKLLDILCGYKQSNSYASALDLLVNLVNRNNTEPEQIKTTIVSGYGIDKNSFYNGYTSEQRILQWLFRKYESEPSDNLAFICMHYAMHCLDYSFEYTEDNFESNKITYGYYSIVDCEGIKQLHSIALDCLSMFFSKQHYHKYVYNLLLNYNLFRRGSFETKELVNIIKNDATLFKKAFADNIDFNNIADCRLVEHFTELYDEAGELSKFYYKWKSNKNFILIKELELNVIGRKEKQKEENLLKRLTIAFESLTIDEIKDLIIDISKIKLENEWCFRKRLTTIIVSLNKEKFLIASTCLIECFPYYDDCYPIITKMLSELGFEETGKLLSLFDTTKCTNWFNTYINQARGEDINESFCEMVINGISENIILYHLNFEMLVRIKEKYPWFLSKYVYALSRADATKSGHIVSSILFRGKAYFNEDTNALIEFFESIEEIETLYKIAIKEQDFFDYDGSLFAAIVVRDERIWFDLLDMYSVSPYHYRKDFCSFKKIWELDNYEHLLDSAIEYLFETKDYFSCEQCLKAIFNSKKSVDAQQVECLKVLISKYSRNEKALHCLLKICNSWTKEQRFDITMFVVSLDKSIETFRECPVAPLPGIMSGSEVPYIDRRIDEYESLMDQLEGIEYLEHRVFCKKIITSLQQQKEQVLKREFIYNY